MNRELAEELVVTDFSELSAYSSTLRESIAQAVEKHVQIVLAVCAGLIALLELRTETAELPLKEALSAVNILIAVAFYALSILGIISVSYVARTRVHYVRIINTINRIRCSYASELRLNGLFENVWTSGDVKAWPIDSIATWSIVGLVLAVELTAFVACVAIQLNRQATLLLVISALIFMITVIRALSCEKLK